MLMMLKMTTLSKCLWYPFYAIMFVNDLVILVPSCQGKKKIMAELPSAERAELSVVALSLNPEYETTALMNLIAQGHGFTHPEFRYATSSSPAAMHEALTSLQFSATRNPQTGAIDHANLFLLVDRDNQIAYRFTLDPRHRAWLRSALRDLLRERHVILTAS